jgi:DNA-binding beta-propeller fold protein YncE
MKNTLIILIFSVVVLSCTKNSTSETDSFLTGNGVFILNEGNFKWGNGSLSFFSYDSAKIYNEIFLDVNGRPLGDVPNSMIINDYLAYIVVNNSGKIEVINRNTLESVATITGLISPRNMAVISSSKAYVTSMYSDSVAIINLVDYTITGYINLRRSSETIRVSDSKAFISEWVGGNEVMVVNTIDNKVVDSIKVGAEPESMVIDENKNLWVLCNGGWARNNYAELYAINTITNMVEKKLVFQDKTASPTCLQIDGKGETLYYLEKGIHKMNINSGVLPALPLIPESQHYFYKFGINPLNGDIFITDAVDYQQKGYVMFYKNDGTLISTYTAGVIPGMICFKLNGSYIEK